MKKMENLKNKRTELLKGLRTELLKELRKERNAKYYKENKEKNSVVCKYCSKSMEKGYYLSHCQTNIHKRLYKLYEDAHKDDTDENTDEGSDDGTSIKVSTTTHCETCEKDVGKKYYEKHIKSGIHIRKLNSK